VRIVFRVVRIGRLSWDIVEVNSHLLVSLVSEGPSDSKSVGLMSVCRDHKTEQYHRGREVKKSRGLQVAHQTNITYASQFIQCLCDGSKDNANEMMGSEAMKNAAHTCTECVTTPSIIVEDLKVCPLPSCSKMSSFTSSRTNK